MTPEEIESQFNALSSSIYAQDRVTSFNSQNNFRKEISRKDAKQQRLRNLFNKAFLSCHLDSFIKSKIISALQGLSSGFKFGIGFALALFTAGIFAVSVTGTFNTFSSGALLKSSEINTNFATLKTAIESIPSQPSMRLIHETDVTGSTNTVNVTGLDGNTDGLYQIYSRFINITGGACNYYIKINGDSSTSYSNQQIIALGNTAANGAGSPGTNQGVLISEIDSTGTIAFFDGSMISKTNAIRGVIGVQSNKVNAGTAVTAALMNGIWNNSSSNITSLQFTSGTNCMGAGSHIEVWARR